MRKALSIGRVLVIYLLAGFVTTWAVAWGLALLPPGRVPRAHMLMPLSLGMTEMWYVGIGSCRVSFDHSHSGYMFVPSYWSPGATQSPDWNSIAAYLDLTWAEKWGQRHRARDASLVPGFDFNPYEVEGLAGLDDARGFPFVALWCSWGNEVMPIDNDGAPWSAPNILSGGLALPDDVGGIGTWDRYARLRALPYYPIWSGLALNTAFYAMVFFAFVRLTRAVKHARRYRRGLCPMCKYDRVFDYSRPCPKCGSEARGRKIHAAAAV